MALMHGQVLQCLERLKSHTLQGVSTAGRSDSDQSRLSSVTRTDLTRRPPKSDMKGTAMSVGFTTIIAASPPLPVAASATTSLLEHAVRTSVPRA